MHALKFLNALGECPIHLINYESVNLINENISLLEFFLAKMDIHVRSIQTRCVGKVTVL